MVKNRDGMLIYRNMRFKGKVDHLKILHVNKVSLVRGYLTGEIHVQL